MLTYVSDSEISPQNNVDFDQFFEGLIDGEKTQEKQILRR